ncbi:transcriptional regulator [Alcanivorax sp.]|jgi:putative transcriptional regulator|uniref:helix-turn-helix domain-containing protein n=1 Tax=Alcanivorax sp. TaxID=1872427 RepID=UPI0025C276B1|nr:transcriptional regulator [Alcanivorax sp.]
MTKHSDNKRDIFGELTEGFEALQDARQGKWTLQTTELEMKEPLVITAEEIRSLRESLKVSRPIFANMLRMSVRTLERWEQDRGKPDQGSATLMRLIQRHPETLEWIREL